MGCFENDLFHDPTPETVLEKLRKLYEQNSRLPEPDI